LNDHRIHDTHPHTHGPNCGHTAVLHDGHTDYLHDGHLHHPHESHVDEHVLAVSASNPAACTPEHACGGHDTGHVHGPDCGTRGSHTAITWTTSSMDTCTVPTDRTATITAFWRSPNSGCRQPEVSSTPADGRLRGFDEAPPDLGRELPISREWLPGAKELSLANDECLSIAACARAASAVVRGSVEPRMEPTARDRAPPATGISGRDAISSAADIDGDASTTRTRPKPADTRHRTSAIEIAVVLESGTTLPAERSQARA